MPRLNMIEIRESEVTYTNQRDWFFHPVGHHVRELLLHFIGKDFTLDGSSKFSAIFGELEEEDDPICSSIFGVTSFHIVDFDVEAFMKLPMNEQQEILLTEVTNALVAVAKKAGSDPNVIKNAAAEVRRNDFAFEIPIKKLGRSTKNRKLKVEVMRCLGPEIGEVWEMRVLKKDGTVCGSEDITDRPDSLDRTDQFSKSSWDGNTFQIFNTRFKELEFSADITPYLEIIE